jgi:hypothetical protein
MSRKQPDTSLFIDSWRNRRRVRRLKAGGLFTIKEVGDACGMPQPVVAQLVPRTETDAGWMSTGEQLAYAMEIAVGFHFAWRNYSCSGEVVADPPRR